MITRRINSLLTAAVIVVSILTASLNAQKRDGKDRGSAKPITVPVTIRLRGSKPEVEMRFVDPLLREDGEVQTILSVRGRDAPLWVAILIQDDLVSSVANEVRGLGSFIRNLPPGSRVMIGYIQSGTLDVRRKFTSDLEKAAKGLRSPMSLASASPFNPYVEIIEALKKFDSQPLSRRAIIVVSDGLDISRGADTSGPSQSIDLQRAINDAQRRSVAIYSIFVPSAASTLSPLSLNGQSCLERLSSETGGRAYFQGNSAPVSFEPFLKDIDGSLKMQFALTYLSTHTTKGFHKLDIRPIEPDVELRHPAGYTR